MKTIRHPTLPVSVTFDQATHEYRMPELGHCVSFSTTRISESFLPAFDSESASARVAARTGQEQMALMAQWTEKRDESAAYGTAVHAYAEALVMGRALPEPATDRERAAFKVVDRAVSMLARSYEWVAAEQIVFDPAWRIAGTIDLVATHRETRRLAIIDWKTCEKITADAYGRMCLPPLAHLPASKLTRYALQLGLYATILRDGEYPMDAWTGYEAALVHIAPGATDPRWIPLEIDWRACELALDEHGRRLASGWYDAKK